MSVPRKILNALGVIVGVALLYIAARLTIFAIETWRFRSIEPGTPARAIEQRFGVPSHVERVDLRNGMDMVTGCDEHCRQCWFYYSEWRGDHFVCFNADDEMIRTGRALVFR